MSKLNLWEKVQAAQGDTIAVMGMTKNTGKTVVLNTLLAQGATRKIPVGITSIGLDGESRDQVFKTPKPLIRVWEGTIIATARDTLNRARISCTKIGTTGFDSPMGEILLVRADETGDVEVGGATRSSEQMKVMEQLRELGCQKIFLDGALGRSHHASPALADGVILATGAALGGSIQDVLRKTKERLQILTLPKGESSTIGMARIALTECRVAVWDNHGKRLPIEGKAALTSAKELRSVIHSEVAIVAFGGAVGYSAWEAVLELAKANSGLLVLVSDATRLFVEQRDVNRLREFAGTLKVIDPIYLLGVTLNPTSPWGAGFDPQEFLDTAREELSEWGVTDVMLETN